ncbi:MAG: sulfatase-like hydrolase/transferase [Lentisphaerae bacterium]|nr:sulfatase-like hydrolase/transferase [Lentisphaerota bacterium]
MIHSDQHRFDTLGVNGHSLVRTPNLDRLAADGVNFTQAFCPTPICSPERASLITGCWPTRHGCMSIPGTEIYQPAHADLPLLPSLLHAAGYFVAHIAKFHNETAANPDKNGADVYIPESAYDQWRKARGVPPCPMPVYRGNDLLRWFGAVDKAATAATSRLAWGAGEVEKLLDHCAGQKRPFFIRWDPSEPHPPCQPPPEFAALYPPKSVPPWPSFADTLEGKPFIQGQQRRTWGIDGWRWNGWAPVVARYLAVVSLLDAQVGRLLDALRRLNLEQDTLVVYTTDHGDLCGGHGMIDKHFVLYDDVVRVPLIMRLPGVVPAGRTCEAFVTNAIDLATTFCRAAGIRQPATFGGRDLLPYAAGIEANPRTDIFAMWQGSQFGLYSQRMVRDRRWKYVWNAVAEDELYDLASDPGELTNLAMKPKCRDELQRLRGRLVKWMEEIEDPLLNGWTSRQIEQGLKP